MIGYRFWTCPKQLLMTSHSSKNTQIPQNSHFLSKDQDFTQKNYFLYQVPGTSKFVKKIHIGVVRGLQTWIFEFHYWACKPHISKLRYLKNQNCSNSQNRELFFLTAIWLPHSQLLADIKGALSLTLC